MNEQSYTEYSLGKQKLNLLIPVRLDNKENTKIRKAHPLGILKLNIVRYTSFEDLDEIKKNIQSSLWSKQREKINTLEANLLSLSVARI